MPSRQPSRPDGHGHRAADGSAGGGYARGVTGKLGGRRGVGVFEEEFAVAGDAGEWAVLGVAFAFARAVC